MKRPFLIWILIILSSILCFIHLSASFKTHNKYDTQFSFLKYDVEIQDKKMGWMTSTKNTSESDPNAIHFIVDSKVMVNVVTTYTILFNSHIIFKNSHLYYSDYLTQVNKDTQSYSTIKWDGSRYIGWDGKKKSILSEKKVTYSIGNIHYKEPVGQSRIFSEKYMTMCPITKSGDYYTVSFPDGKSTLYKYQNGICIWAQAKQKLYKITFRLKEIN